MDNLSIQQAFELATQRYKAGELAEAERLCRQILGQLPDHPSSLRLLGYIAQRVGKPQAAVDFFSRGAALRPNDFECVRELGNALKTCGRFDEAIDALQRAIALKPDFAATFSNLGNAYVARGDVDRAIAAFQRAVELKPDYAEALSNLGNVLQEKGETEQAIAAHRRAVALMSDVPEAHFNLGIALAGNRDAPGSIAAYRKTIALKQDYANAHFNLGLVLLASGHFQQGWEEFDWRLEAGTYPPSQPKIPQKPWDGRPLSGLRLFLHDEGGLGDTIHFVRYLPQIASRLTGGKMILRCQPPLRRLLKPITTALGCELITSDQPMPTFDEHCPLLSLPRVFGTDLQNIPSTIPYLMPDAADVATWRDRLSRRPGEKLVGLAWAGSPGNTNDRNRSMPVSHFAALAKTRNVGFVSLQKGAAASQAPPPDLCLLHFTDDLKDMADTAALIANLDLVISVDTAVAHLASAMAKPVWTLLPFAAEWRWLQDRTDSPWYPTMRLFRQSKRGDWQTLMEEVAAALAKF